MKNQSKIIYLLFIVVSVFAGFFSVRVPNINAADPFPSLQFPCDETNPEEFHSLRPYQASPCGDANKALFCSNEIQFIETFDFANNPRCSRSNPTEDYWCNVNYHVNKHNLYIELTDSMLPILGNTEQVKNSQGGTEEFDDAFKLSEYASWYLSGVNGRAEYGEPTEDQAVNFSGPLKKLLPSAIQDAQRIVSIDNHRMFSTHIDEETGETIFDAHNHDQVVVCAKEEGFGWLGNLLGIGITRAKPCYEGDKYRLSDWIGDLSLFNRLVKRLGYDVWNKKIPPLPWEFDDPAKYRKAYKEWRGESCFKIPGTSLNMCIENPFVPNKWATLYQHIPLSSTTDKKGANYIIGDGPTIQGNRNTTIISGGQFTGFRNAPLYFAHAQEVMELSDLLNKTYTPEGYESEALPETTEDLIKNQFGLDCSAVNIRSNPGDDLFPGDPDEMQVNDVEYNIDSVLCKVTTNIVTLHNNPNNLNNCPGEGPFGTCTVEIPVVKCIAQTYITLRTGIKAPNADEIFSQTVADSGSTFRKIFPKVEEGAPVSCIADIPGVTNVTYDPSQSQRPPGSEQEVKITNYPEDGVNVSTQLTFPHLGSVYEYFLKGIQTALRPQGMGEPLTNGICKPAVECGDWESKLGGSGGACGICNAPIGDLAKRILTAAGETYGVPAANIWAAMKHEGADGYQGTTYDFSDENVRKWSNSAACGGESMPGCNNDTESTQPPFGFLSYWFYLGDGDNALWKAVQAIDPTRDSKHKVSRCNFLDAAFAAAKTLRQGTSNTAAGLSCGPYSFDTTQPAGCNWSDTKVAQSQNSYAGYCVNGSPGQLYSIEDAVGWYHSASCQ